MTHDRSFGMNGHGHSPAFRYRHADQPRAASAATRTRPQPDNPVSTSSVKVAGVQERTTDLGAQSAQFRQVRQRPVASTSLSSRHFAIRPWCSGVMVDQRLHRGCHCEGGFQRPRWGFLQRLAFGGGLTGSW